METICAANVARMIIDIGEAADFIKRCAEGQRAPRYDADQHAGRLMAWRDHLLSMSCAPVAIQRAAA